MKHAKPFSNQPAKVTIEFNQPVRTWNFCRNVKVGHNSQDVTKITIEGADWQYHTYGDGLITYYAEWFSKSCRPLVRHEITFDTTQIKSIQMKYN